MVAAAATSAGLSACTGDDITKGGLSSEASGVKFDGARATVSAGSVKGSEVADGVFSWYGIPYGEAPIGDLRWSAPKTRAAWTDELDCSKMGERSLQYSGGKVIGSEDCLNLTVTARDGESGKPVLVYIHGGNNQTGDARELIGNELVSTLDCVYVSLNYRLGLFGFNCLPALQSDDDATGNYALLDIKMALDWVAENISVFGGDPDNITIAGFSAGGRDVMAMLISPLFEGAFKRAIVFSGGMTTCDESAASVRVARALAPLALEDGIADTSEEAVAWLLANDNEVEAYVRGLEAERLALLMANASIRMSVFPHLYEDGVALPRGGFDGALYNDVPVIMLTGSSEFGLFSNGDSWWQGEEAAGLSDDELTAAKNFSCTYGNEMYRIFNAQESANTMMSGCEQPIYVCEVNYGDDASKMKDELSGYGAFHGIFIPMLSSTNSYTSMLPGVFESESYQAMGEVFRSYIANYMKTGDPNSEELEEWVAWSSDCHESLCFDADAEGAVVKSLDKTTTYGDIIERMELDTTVSDEIKSLVAKNVMNGRWFSKDLDEYYAGNWSA